jgi:hypothetical protein
MLLLSPAGLHICRPEQIATEGTQAMPALGQSADQSSIPDMAAAIRPYATDISDEVVKNCWHFQPEEHPEAVTVLTFLEKVRTMGIPKTAA